MKAILLTGWCLALTAWGAFLLARQAAQTAEPPTATEERAARLVRDLENDRFEVRKQAEEELLKLGKPAIAPLRRVLAAKPTLELATRATRLLEQLVIYDDGGPIVDGLKVRLTVDRETMRPGDAATFTTWLCNLTDADLNLSIGYSYCGDYFDFGSVFRSLEGDGARAKEWQPVCQVGFCGTGAYPLFVTIPAKSAVSYTTPALFGKTPQGHTGLLLGTKRYTTLQIDETGMHRIRVAFQVQKENNAERGMARKGGGGDLGRPANENAKYWTGAVQSNEVQIQVTE